MEDNIQTEQHVIVAEGIRSQLDGNGLRDKLLSVEGVESVRIDGDRVTVDCFPQVLSYSGIKSILEKAGFPSKKVTEKQGFVQRFIARLTRANREAFGSGQLDCCKLNRPQKRR